MLGAFVCLIIHAKNKSENWVLQSLSSGNRPVSCSDKRFVSNTTKSGRILSICDAAATTNSIIFAQVSLIWPHLIPMLCAQVQAASRGSKTSWSR